MFLIPYLVASYLFGSVPFGLVVGFKVKGIDIRQYGSGNIGATNVTRVIGKKWGITVFVLDCFKGFLPVFLAYLFFPDAGQWFLMLSALAAICGHNWSVFLKYKGGKGVSTTIGVLSGLCFANQLLMVPLLAAVLVWVIVFYSTHYVSVASLLGALSFFLLSAWLLQWEFKALAAVIVVFIVIRHKPNIRNLLKRKEAKT